VKRNWFYQRRRISTCIYSESWARHSWNRQAIKEFHSCSRGLRQATSKAEISFLVWTQDRPDHPRTRKILRITAKWRICKRQSKQFSLNKSHTHAAEILRWANICGRPRAARTLNPDQIDFLKKRNDSTADWLKASRFYNNKVTELAAAAAEIRIKSTLQTRTHWNRETE
jgi:hypothetical protein